LVGVEAQSLASSSRVPAEEVAGVRGRRAASWHLDAVAVVGLVLLGVAAPALLALWTHSLGIPRNDDWAYRRVLLGFVRTGNYSLVGWGSMTLVGQVLWSAPFVLVLGARPWVPSLSVAVLAAGGLAAGYLLARGQLSRAKAGGAVLLLVALPGFALSTADFMTDVPSLSAEMVCLLLGALALRSSGRAQLLWLASSMAAGVFGFSIREFDLAAPVAVLVALAWSDWQRAKACALFAGALAVACGAVYLWSAGLPGAQPKMLGLPTADSWETLGGAYFTLSFMVSPVVPGAIVGWGVLGRGQRGGRPAAVLAAVLAAAAVLAVGWLLVTGRHPLFIGNYLDRQGSGGDRVLAGTRPELFPGLVWTGFKVLALASGAALAAVLAKAAWGLARRWRGWLRPRPQRAQPQREGDSRVGERRLVLLFTGASAALLAGYDLFARAPFWDRYLWPVAFGVAVLALGAPAETVLAGTAARFRRQLRAAHLARRPGAGLLLQGLARHLGRWGWRAATFLAALVVGATAVVLTLNSDSYDAARWSAGRQLAEAGYPVGVIDAGIEWVGSHTAALARPGRVVAGAPPYEQWYVQMFRGASDCAVVSASPLLSPSIHLMTALSYHEIAFARPERLYLYAVDNWGCKAFDGLRRNKRPGQP
jgi:hypothetical protein